MFDNDQLNALAARALVRPHVAKALAQYQRDTLRIARIRRVLDPDDADAVMVTGDVASHEEEIERREARIADTRPHLEIALSSPLTPSEQKQTQKRAKQLADLKRNLGIGA